MRPSREQKSIHHLKANLLAMFASALFFHPSNTHGQSPPALPQTSTPPTSGFSVQSPPHQQSEPPPQSPPQQGQQNLIPVLPMPMGSLEQPQRQQSTTPSTFLAPAPSLPSLSGPSEIQAYDPRAERRPVLIFKTSEGEFKVRFNKQWAPFNVENVMNLALGLKEFTDIRTGKKVKRPFYTGLTCHRVIKGFLIQCGCPFGNGRGGPGYAEKDEVSSFVKVDRPGLIVMAPQVGEVGGVRKYIKHSNGSQFFISLAPMPELDGQATIIGEISSGMDTIKRIASTPTGPTDRPIKKVIIFSADPDTASSSDMPPPGIDPFKN